MEMPKAKVAERRKCKLKEQRMREQSNENLSAKHDAMKQEQLLVCDM